MNNRLKNVIRFVFPTLLSNLSIFLFTIVDGIFVGNGIGSDALGAINVAYPFIMLIGAVNALLSIGGSSIFAVSVGRKDKKQALSVFRTSLLLSVFTSIFFTFIGLAFNKQISIMMGASGIFLPYTEEYIIYCSFFFLPQAMSICLQNFSRNDDSPSLVSLSVIVSTTLNIIGDWLFIFPLKMGMKGAALATGISQTVGLLVVLLHFRKKDRILSFGKIKLTIKEIKLILVRGLPSAIGQLEAPIMTIAMNVMLSRFIGPIGITAFSVISYVSTFTVAVFFGISDGLQPLFGRSYGEEDEKSLSYYRKAGFILNAIGAVITISAVILIRKPICILFGLSGEDLLYTTLTLPKYAWGFASVAMIVIIASYLYSTERSKESFVINIFRSIILPLAITFTLPYIFGAESIWYTFGIFETITLIIACVIYKKAEKKRTKKS